MMKDHKHNHGKVGEALKVKMTLEKFNEVSGNKNQFPNLTEFTIEELRKYRCYAGVPLIIDESTQGDYEVICENGAEVHYYEE